jgi:hypothetical protein
MSKTELKFIGVLEMTKVLGITWFGDLNLGKQRLMIVNAAKEKNVKIEYFCLDGIIIEAEVKVAPEDLTGDAFLELIEGASQVKRIHEMMNRGYAEKVLVRCLYRKSSLRLSGLADAQGELVRVDLDLGNIWMNSSPNESALVYEKGTWAKIV